MNAIAEAFFDEIYELGGFFVKVFKKIGKALLTLAGRFALLLSGMVKSLFSAGRRFAVRISKTVALEIKTLASDVKKGFSLLGKNIDGGGKARLFPLLSRGAKKHSPYFRAAFSTLIPVLAVIVLVLFSATLGRVTFAVDVAVGGQSVGTLNSEQEYRQALAQAKKRLALFGEDFTLGGESYRIKMIAKGAADDIGTVCDNIIKQCSEQTVYACGIYIDGEFICLVDCEDTYNRVSKALLNEYALENGVEGDDSEISFAPEITLDSGLFPGGSGLWSADKLGEYLSSYKSESIEYTSQDGDTLESIAARFGVGEDELLSLNENLDGDNIPEGSVLLIQRGERTVPVKIVTTYYSLETSPFQTVIQYDSSLQVGTRYTLVQGVPGRDIVTYKDTYIDGERVSHEVQAVRYNANEPVNQLDRVGTRGVPVDDDSVPVSPRLLRDQGGSFLWPAPDNCFWLSQGYREGVHRGIDIVSSDSGSCRGRRIVAVADGVVVTATYHYSWGYYIRIDHGSGVVTGYAHALEGSFRVGVGDVVKKGQHISSIGTTGNSTGYHLHFEVWLDGTRVNPLPYVYSEYYGAAVR